jgi:hypothetical protein
MEPISSTDMAVLAARIESLGVRLDALASRAESRKWITIVAGGAVVIGMLGYLRYLHSTIAQFADPNVLVELAAANTEPRLDAEISSLGENLVAQAPEVITMAEKAVLESPPQLAGEARRFLATHFDGQISRLEGDVYESLRGLLSVALSRAVEKGVNLADPAQVNALVEQAIPLVRSELKGKVLALYDEYASGAESIGGFVERLASSPDLSPVEKQQREILLTGLTIIQKMESDPSRRPLHGILEGKAPDTN